MTKQRTKQTIFYLLFGWALLGTLCAQSAPQAKTGGTYGEVHFANSGAPAAQASFLRGLAQLHNFQYAQAESLFQDAEKADANFAMAYWGEALTHVHPLWNYEDLEGARSALRKLGDTPEARAAKAPTAREKMYLQTVDILFGDGDRDTRNRRYADSLAELHKRYPQDVDAAAFYALALLGTTSLNRDYATYMRAASVLEEYFPGNQQHPGVVHYLIHSYDDPMHAPLGLRAARLYGKIAPDSGHALHMTSHIFIAMGMWQAVVRANLESLATQRGDKDLPCNHANSWLSYGYLQQGKLQEAHDVVASCTTQTRTMSDQESQHYSQTMMAHYIFGAERWTDDFLQIPPPPAQFVNASVMYAYFHGFAAARRGDIAALEQSLEQLKAAHVALREKLAKQPHPNNALETNAA